MTSAGVIADVQVPSLLIRIITLTRCAGMSVLKASFELALKSSGGGVNDEDFSKLMNSRAYIRLRGGKSDSSSSSEGFGVA